MVIMTTPVVTPVVIHTSSSHDVTVITVVEMSSIVLVDVISASAVKTEV